MYDEGEYSLDYQLSRFLTLEKILDSERTQVLKTNVDPVNLKIVSEKGKLGNIKISKHASAWDLMRAILTDLYQGVFFFKHDVKSYTYVKNLLEWEGS